MTGERDGCRAVWEVLGQGQEQGALEDKKNEARKSLCGQRGGEGRSE